MTREEAISIMNVIVHMLEPQYDTDRIEDAVEMAIKALEQQPCEDEYIKVPKKALKYRTAGMVAYNAEWLKKHWQMELKVMGIECDDAISREDALNSLIENTDFEGWELSQALEAIEKLPFVTQKPIERDDAISRKAVDELSKELVHITRDKADFLCNFWEGLRKLPPVTPQQKYGKWIKKGNTLKCPFCGAKGEDIKDDYCFNYCPNCGAKMQESKETGEIHCNHTDTEIAKSFIEDVEAVKELLPKAGK